MAIEQILHRIWIGGPQPKEYLRYGETWREHHPGWQHRLWDEEALAELPMRSRALYDQAEAQAPNDSIRWRVDIARLEILYQYGGIYVDCDTECLRPVDDLLRHRMFLPQTPNNPNLVTNAVMGAEAGHPFLGRLIRDLPANIATHRGWRLVDTVGGGYITRQLNTLLPAGVEVLPWWLFAAQSIRNRDRGLPAKPHRDAYANHLYGNTRGRRRAGVR